MDLSAALSSIAVPPVTIHSSDLRRTIYTSKKVEVFGDSNTGFLDFLFYEQYLGPMWAFCGIATIVGHFIMLHIGPVHGICEMTTIDSAFIVLHIGPIHGICGMTTIDSAFIVLYFGHMQALLGMTTTPAWWSFP
jgi:hypothetical protein